MSWKTRKSRQFQALKSTEGQLAQLPKQTVKSRSRRRGARSRPLAWQRPAADRSSRNGGRNVGRPRIDQGSTPFPGQDPAFPFPCRSADNGCEDRRHSWRGFYQPFTFIHKLSALSSQLSA